MTKLTTELLEEFVSDIKTDGMCDITDSQVELALIRLLAYEQAAKNPVAEMGAARTPLYAAPVLLKQPDATLTDEGTKIIKAAEKLVRCKGRYHSEQNYRALAALFGMTVPDLPPLPSDEASIIPVSEHKWISVDYGMPENCNTVLVCSNRGIIWCAEVEDGDFYPDEFPNLPREGFEITHWMPLPAAPAQESE